MPEIGKSDTRLVVIKDALAKQDAAFGDMLPKFLRAQKERFMQLAIETAQRPEIIGCEPASIVASVMKAAQCGLPLDGTHAALTPFRDNQNNVTKAQFIPMFQGLIVAAMRNGGVGKVWSAVVYEGDDFREVLGSSPKIEHVPALRNRTIDKAIGVYACAKLKTGETVHEFMDRAQIDVIKSRSKAKKGPWSNPQDEPEMWRKTAVRRLAKYLPKSPDLQQVLEADDEFDALEPREVEYEPVGSSVPPAATSGGKARQLGDLVPPTHGAQQTTNDEPPQPRWYRDIEITIGAPPETWLDATINAKGALNGKTYRDAATSSDETIRKEVDRLLTEGAAIQSDKGATPDPFQRLAEACRLLRSSEAQSVGTENTFQ